MNAASDPQLENTMLRRELQWARLKIEALQEQLRRERISKYGPQSETLSDLQLKLLEEESGVTGEEVEAEARREPVTSGEARQRKPHPGRQRLPESLPRVAEVIACAGQNCMQRGSETTVIGYDESEVLDVEPARYYVRVVRREKRSCRSCDGGSVVMPDLAPRIIEKGLASDTVVVETIVAKYCNHLPLFRQAAILEREAGMAISRATLDGWVMRVGELLQPVVRAMRQQLLAAGYLQADETIVPCRCTTSAEPIIRRICGNMADRAARLCSTFGWAGAETVRCSFWVTGKAFCRPTAMRPTIDGRAEACACRLLGARTALICRSRQGKSERRRSGEDGHAHGRIVSCRPRCTRAGTQCAGATRVPATECNAVGDRDSHRECRALAKAMLPKSALGQAVAYTLNMWPKLRRCFDYGHVELSNNLAENSMRPVALGRKNWLHVGSAKAGPKVAAILSLVESCKRLGIPVKAYLLDVLPGMASRTMSDVLLAIIEKRRNLNISRRRVPTACDHLRRGIGGNGSIQRLSRPHTWHLQTTARGHTTGDDDEQVIEWGP